MNRAVIDVAVSESLRPIRLEIVLWRQKTETAVLDHRVLAESVSM